MLTNADGTINLVHYAAWLAGIRIISTTNPRRLKLVDSRDPSVQTTLVVTSMLPCTAFE